MGKLKISSCLDAKTKKVYDRYRVHDRPYIPLELGIGSQKSVAVDI